MKNLLLLFSLCYSFILIAQHSYDDVVQSVLVFQQEENELYSNPEKSPMRYESDPDEFEGLPFFDIDTAFYVVAKFQKAKRKKKFKMKTSTDRLPKYRVYGVASFKIKGILYQLNLYQSMPVEKDNENLFLPFTDLTNSEETYGGGRYINMQIPKGKSIVIDFNKAYNPYCAYSSRYSCPVPPKENFLNVKIEAGVKYEEKAH